ncbi:MAG: Sec-independent protein translocase subunit TatA/TatB [Actinomycetota bacterium]
MTGPAELILPILGIIILIFGAKRLPEIARSLGKSKGEFKKGLQEGGSAESGQPETEEPRPVEAPKAE